MNDCGYMVDLCGEVFCQTVVPLWVMGVTRRVNMPGWLNGEVAGANTPATFVKH